MTDEEFKVAAKEANNMGGRLSESLASTQRILLEREQGYWEHLAEEVKLHRDRVKELTAERDAGRGRLAQNHKLLEAYRDGIRGAGLTEKLYWLDGKPGVTIENTLPNIMAYKKEIETLKADLAHSTEGRRKLHGKIETMGNNRDTWRERAKEAEAELGTWTRSAGRPETKEVEVPEDDRAENTLIDHAEGLSYQIHRGGGLRKAGTSLLSLIRRVVNEERPKEPETVVGYTSPYEAALAANLALCVVCGHKEPVTREAGSVIVCVKKGKFRCSDYYCAACIEKEQP